MSLPCAGTDYPFSNLQQLCRDAARGDRAPLGFEAMNTRKDGSTYPVEVRATISSSLVSPKVILLANDISERKLSEERIGDLATYDRVTHLDNRRSLESRLVRTMHQVRCSGKSIALLMIKIDRPTDIRHADGQELADFAARLKSCARTNDVVAHLAGDKFVSVVESVDDVDALIARGADAVNIAFLNSTRQQIMPLPGIEASAGAPIHGSSTVGSRSLADRRFTRHPNPAKTAAQQRIVSTTVSDRHPSRTNICSTPGIAREEQMPIGTQQAAK